MPLGLPKNNTPVPAPVQRREQPPAQVKEYDLPSPPPPQLWEHPQVQQTNEPVTAPPQVVQTQSLPQPLQIQQQHQEPVQWTHLGQHTTAPDYFQEDARQDIPGVHINQENNVNTSPGTHINQENSVNTSSYQQLPLGRLPEPDHVPPLRRSNRATRGQTSRYDDFVQTIHPVYPQPHMSSSCYHYQYPQMMTSQMMQNQMMSDQIMSNQLMTNEMMTNNLPQPTMLWYR